MTLFPYRYRYTTVSGPTDGQIQPATQLPAGLVPVRQFSWQWYPAADRPFVSCLAHVLNDLFDSFVARQAYKFPKRYCSTMSRLLALMFPVGTLRVVSAWRGGSWTWQVDDAGHEWNIIKAPSGTDYVVDITATQYDCLNQPETMPARRNGQPGSVAILPLASVPAQVYQQIDYERHINPSLVVDVLTDMESIGGLRLNTSFLDQWAAKIHACYRQHGMVAPQRLPLQPTPRTP